MSLVLMTETNCIIIIILTLLLLLLMIYYYSIIVPYSYYVPSIDLMTIDVVSLIIISGVCVWLT